MPVKFNRLIGSASRFETRIPFTPLAGFLGSVTREDVDSEWCCEDHSANLSSFPASWYMARP